MLKLNSDEFMRLDELNLSSGRTSKKGINHRKSSQQPTKRSDKLSKPGTNVDIKMHVHDYIPQAMAQPG